jgi:hypothetical protein
LEDPPVSAPACVSHGHRRCRPANNAAVVTCRPWEVGPRLSGGIQGCEVTDRGVRMPMPPSGNLGRPWRIRRVCPDPWRVGPWPGHRPSAQRRTMSAHYIVDAARGSCLWIKATSPALDVTEMVANMGGDDALTYPTESTVTRIVTCNLAVPTGLRRGCRRPSRSPRLPYG